MKRRGSELKEKPSSGDDLDFLINLKPIHQKITNFLSLIMSS